MEKETFPLRLISIEKTLASDGGMCFVPCVGWNFHVISHTWTKDVRDWSIAISSLMHSVHHDHLCNNNKPIDRYAELFQRHSFTNRKGHSELVEFLRILAQDGVKKVWFDALCINQGDAGEKDREITHMGAYYAQSEGCYVWCHGVGGGFRLWASAPSPEFYKLPRWFTRVWTLQEFVLPKRLTFIVGMDMEGFAPYFSYKAFCRSTSLIWCPRELMGDGAMKKFGPHFERSMHLLNSKKHFPCPHCGHHSSDGLSDGLISKGNSGHVYYVERLSYFDLMERSGFKSLVNHRVPATFWPRLKFALERLSPLLYWPVKTYNHNEVTEHDGKTTHDVGDEAEKNGWPEKRRRLQLSALALREISMRECSEGHDEDRLLSILALLEIEGKVQLRTGKSLEDQILDVVQGLLNSTSMHSSLSSRTASMEHENYRDILALLCLAQYRGNPAIFMSWAPSLMYQMVMGDMKFQKISNYMFHSFRTIAQFDELSRLGLKLRCPFMQAKVIPLACHQEICGTCKICREDSRTIPNPMNHFVLEVQDRQHYSVYLWVRHDDDDDHQEGAKELRFVTACPPTCIMSIAAETSLRKLLSMSVHVWLLLLAEDKLKDRSDCYGLFLVCVGEDIANLHKVGVFFKGPGWDPERDEEPLSDTSSPSISASSEGDEDHTRNEELGIEEWSTREEFEVWKRDKNYMQNFLSSSSSSSSLEEEEEGNFEEEEEAIINNGQETEKDVESLYTWEEDVKCMQWECFNLSGFGPYIPLHLFSFL